MLEAKHYMRPLDDWSLLEVTFKLEARFDHEAGVKTYD
jgi:hypothetical protein